MSRVALPRPTVRALVTAVFALLATLSFAAPSFAAAPEAPETKPATALTARTATLHGVINPKAEASTGFDFTYNTGGTCEPGVTTEHVTEAPRKAVAVSANVTELQPNQTYTFCLVATNLVEEVPGSTSGAPLAFKTLASKPSIDSETASSVNSTEATLEAQVNPNNQATTFSFEYATEASGETLKGTIVKVAGATPLGAEYGDQTATVPRLKALVSGKTYFYRVVTENAQTKVEKAAFKGPVQSFTTVPVPHTDAATAITATSATLNGHLTLNGEVPPVATSFSFSYKLGEECTGGETTPAAEATSPTVSAEVAGLQPNALYSVCLVTSNVSGSETDPASPPVRFKTLAVPPGVGAQSSSEVTSTTATLQALINPNNQATNYRFTYATNEALTENVATAEGAAPLTGFGEQPATVSLSALQPRTEYFYRVTAKNAGGETAEGSSVEHFITLAAPLLTTSPAQGITRTTATLSGTVNPGGLESTYHFAYVPASEYQAGASDPYAKGRTTPQSSSVGADYTAHPAGPTEITELRGGETYDYTVIATNTEGTTVGPRQSFTTAERSPPVVETGEASSITQTAATLSGTVNTQGLATTIQFEVGTTPESGLLLPATVVFTPETGTTKQVTLSYGPGLTPSTTYYYRVIATNVDGTREGATRTFTTAPATIVLTLPAVSPFVPFTPISTLQAKEAQENRGATHSTPPLTRTQQLARALKACKRDKKPAKRHACERQAHKRYGTTKAKGRH